MRSLESWPASLALMLTATVVCVLTVATAVTYK
jgi:hypothetical protein